MHLKGGVDFHCVVSHGGHPCMEPPCTTVCTIETQQTDVNRCKTYGREPEGYAIYANRFKCGTDFQYVVSHGGQPCLARHLCMEPPCTAVRTIETLQQMSTDPTNVVNNPRGTPSMQTDLFERWDRIPMCSFLWWTAMHGRTNVHGTPMCRCPLLSKHKEQVETHAKHMVNNSRGMLCTHLHAFEMRDKLPICGFSWGTAMNEQTSIHGTHMYNCPPYWNAINRQ